MTRTTITNGVCDKCGAIIFSDAPQEFCGACVLERGLGALDEEIDGAALGPTPIRLLMDFGDYELLEEIGRGGQGVVYRARQKSLDRIVALKVIALGQWATEAHLKRFRREAEAVAQLDHPGIVPIYDIGEREGSCYFSMQLVEGRGSLQTISAREQMPPREAVELVTKLARTVAYAHERGILHRDIKPDNVLLDARGEPHLTDFGLARLVEKESNITHTLDVLGTPSYMAPEQAAGDMKRVTAAADVYGLGAVFYQLLTGRPPFLGATSYETIRLLQETEPVRPSTWNRKLDRELETIALKCLEKNPQHRYESAAALVEDLGRWLRHEPVRARPGNVFIRSRKWAHRNPIAIVSMAAAVIVAGVIGLTVWQSSVRERQARLLPNSLAVVFRSADAKEGSLAKEYSRDLNHLLSQVSSLKVTPRSQVLRWETSNDPPGVIGKALGTKLVLIGTLQATAKDDLRLIVELFDADSGERRWSRRWTEEPADWSSARMQIAREVTASLNLVLSEKEQSLLRRPLTTNQSALAEYFTGRREVDVLTESSLVAAVAHFEQAIHLDPKFAQAYAGLASAHISLGYTFQNPVERFRKARSEIDTALALDPDLPEAKVADGLVKYFYEWDWAGAEQAVEEAVRLDPSMVEADACYLHSLDVLGRGAEPLQRVQRAVALHPASLAIRSELGCAAYYAGKFDEAVRFYDEMLKMDPENPSLYWGLGRTLAQQQLWTQALATLQKGKSKPGGEWSALDAELAYAHARQGQTGEARAIIEKLRARGQNEFVDPYLYAMIYAGLGDADQVFENLSLACDKKSTFIPSLSVDPKFAALRNDPCYLQLLRRLKLPASRYATVDRPEVAPIRSLPR